MRGTACFPDVRLYGGGGLFPHAELQALCPADAGLCAAFGDTLRPDVRRNVVLSRAPECHLDTAHRPAGHPPDGKSKAKGKDVVLRPHLRRRNSTRCDSRHGGNGGLLRRGCSDRVRFLLLPGQGVVEAARTDRGAVLDQCADARRAAVPRFPLWRGV